MLRQDIPQSHWLQNRVEALKPVIFEEKMAQVPNSGTRLSIKTIKNQQLTLQIIHSLVKLVGH